MEASCKLRTNSSTLFIICTKYLMHHLLNIFLVFHTTDHHTHHTTLLKSELPAIIQMKPNFLLPIVNLHSIMTQEIYSQNDVTLLNPQVSLSLLKILSPNNICLLIIFSPSNISMLMSVTSAGFSHSLLIIPQVLKL